MVAWLFWFKRKETAIKTLSVIAIILISARAANAQEDVWVFDYQKGTYSIYQRESDANDFSSSDTECLIMRPVRSVPMRLKLTRLIEF